MKTIQTAANTCTTTPISRSADHDQHVETKTKAHAGEGDRSPDIFTHLYVFFKPI